MKLRAGGDALRSICRGKPPSVIDESREFQNGRCVQGWLNAPSHVFHHIGNLCNVDRHTALPLERLPGEGEYYYALAVLSTMLVEFMEISSAKGCLTYSNL